MASELKQNMLYLEWWWTPTNHERSASVANINLKASNWRVSILARIWYVLFVFETSSFPLAYEQKKKDVLGAIVVTTRTNNLTPNEAEKCVEAGLVGKALREFFWSPSDMCPGLGIGANFWYCKTFTADVPEGGFFIVCLPARTLWRPCG